MENFWRRYRYYGRRWGRYRRISNTQTDVTRWCHMTFWPRDSNAIFEGKITFIVGISNFEIVFQTLYFQTMWEKKWFMSTLSVRMHVRVAIVSQNSLKRWNWPAVKTSGLRKRRLEKAATNFLAQIFWTRSFSKQGSAIPTLDPSGHISKCYPLGRLQHKQ